jgi:hypothetical protein
MNGLAAPTRISCSSSSTKYSSIAYIHNKSRDDKGRGAGNKLKEDSTKLDKVIIATIRIPL